jgi:hypothetical protein
MVHDPENREYLVAQQVGVSDAAQQEYAAHYGKYDIHFQAAMARRKLSAGMVQLSQHVDSLLIQLRLLAVVRLTPDPQPFLY